MKLGEYAEANNLEVDVVKAALKETGQTIHPQHNVDVQKLNEHFGIKTGEGEEKGLTQGETPQVSPSKPEPPPVKPGLITEQPVIEEVPMEDPAVSEVSSQPVVQRQSARKVYGQPGEGKKLYHCVSRGNPKSVEALGNQLAWGYDESGAIAEIMRGGKVGSHTVNWHCTAVPGNDPSRAPAE